MTSRARIITTTAVGCALFVALFFLPVILRNQQERRLLEVTTMRSAEMLRLDEFITTFVRDNGRTPNSINEVCDYLPESVDVVYDRAGAQPKYYFNWAVYGGPGDHIFCGDSEINPSLTRGLSQRQIMACRSAMTSEGQIVSMASMSQKQIDALSDHYDPRR